MADPTSGDEYVPPDAASVASAQISLKGLRLLLSQRRLYSIAKRWASLRFIGISVIAVVAPILTATWSSLAVVVGAASGLWIFLSRTVFLTFEQRYSSRAADVQEQFDQFVFEMPDGPRRVPHVTPEEISTLVGEDADALAAAKAEDLERWYPIDSALDGASAIAICQRANAAYSERLLNSNANIWLVLTVGWSLVVLAVGLFLGLSVADFVLGVALPLLPALLDVFDQWRSTRTAGAERRALAASVEDAIRDQTSSLSISGADLLVWQDQIYNFRRKTPQVPDLIYKRVRKKNELAMHAAAAELAEAALKAKDEQ